MEQQTGISLCLSVSLSPFSLINKFKKENKNMLLLPRPALNRRSPYQAWHLVPFLPVPGVATSGLPLIHSLPVLDLGP